MADDPIVGKLNYRQGDEGGVMEFLLIVDKGSTNAEVDFSAVKPNPGGSPISIPRTRVASSEKFIVGTQTHVDAGYESEIIYRYYPNGSPLAPGFSLQFRVNFSTAEGVGAHTVSSRGAES
jgi:hypothetical protein